MLARGAWRVNNIGRLFGRWYGHQNVNAACVVVRDVTPAGEEQHIILEPLPYVWRGHGVRGVPVPLQVVGMREQAQEREGACEADFLGGVSAHGRWGPE